MNETDTLINKIDSWTADVLADDLKMAAWVAACQSTNDAHKDAVIDDLLGEKETHMDGEWRICPHKKTMEVYHKGKWIETASNSIMGKSATSVWIDDPWKI